VIGYYGSCKTPWGNDTINAVDGEADNIDCGPGTDVANVDPIDTVANCETVNVVGAAGGGKGPGGSGSGGKSGGDKQAAIALVGSAKLKQLLAGKLKVSVPCAAACRITVTATANGKTIASGKATLLQAGTAKVKLTVGKKAKKAVKRAKTLKVTLSASVAAASGKPVKLAKTVTLRR
jgi:hypothetical protein